MKRTGFCPICVRGGQKPDGILFQKTTGLCPNCVRHGNYLFRFMSDRKQAGRQILSGFCLLQKRTGLCPN